MHETDMSSAPVPQFEKMDPMQVRSNSANQGTDFGVSKHPQTSGSWKSSQQIVPLPPRVRARQILDSDVPSVADLLARGFRRRTRPYWVRALDRLASHPHAVGLPKYGYLMECDNQVVGVILLISSVIPREIGWTIRCNLASWYVEAAFRNHASLLVKHALKRGDVTYVNISPAPHTWSIVEAQGFRRYSNGQFATLPALGVARGDPQVRIQEGRIRPDTHFESFEWQLLLTHAEYGCISFWCTTPERAYPFVFRRRFIKGIVPCAQLIYSRDVKDFVRFAREIGRFLALRGSPVILVDSNGPIPGLPGKFFDGTAPKYFRGPERPRLGDLAYTEAAMFGL
jgi:hypothetical protein